MSTSGTSQAVPVRAGRLASNVGAFAFAFAVAACEPSRGQDHRQETVTIPMPPTGVKDSCPPGTTPIDYGEQGRDRGGSLFGCALADETPQQRIQGLRALRAAIANDPKLPQARKREGLAEIDAVIRRLTAAQKQNGMPAPKRP